MAKTILLWPSFQCVILLFVFVLTQYKSWFKTIFEVFCGNVFYIKRIPFEQINLLRNKLFIGCRVHIHTISLSMKLITFYQTLTEIMTQPTKLAN